ncbi:hypothetical protein AMTRI_Chr12g238950 [Amborella trichopoda]
MGGHEPQPLDPINERDPKTIWLILVEKDAQEIREIEDLIYHEVNHLIEEQVRYRRLNMEDFPSTPDVVSAIIGELSWKKPTIKKKCRFLRKLLKDLRADGGPL